MKAFYIHPAGEIDIAYYTRITHPDSGPYGHRLAPAADINGGGEEFVFETPFENPIYLYRGAGRLAGEFHPCNPNVRISLHPTGAKQGIPLITQSPDSQIESNQINGEGVYSG